MATPIHTVITACRTDRRDRPEATTLGPCRTWLTVVTAGLWLVIGFVALPLLAFGLERTGAIFGGWGDWPEWWARDLWVHEAHPERFQDVINVVVGSVTESPTPTRPRR